MHTFEVWAPNANEVTLKLQDETIALEKQERGYWRTRVANAKAGDDYFYILDRRDPPFPDPRSLWQPSGVHGPSRLIDHCAFPWTDRGWQAPPLSGAIIYELHVGTFTPAGTFESAIEKLDYLRKIGITHVELMPVNEFPGNRGWGYDGADIFAPHHAYGGPDGLKRLVNACHERGLAVLLDVVYNHLGPVGNYLSPFGPYFNENYHTPWGAAVNLDGAGSTEVRRFFCDNALMWLRDYHCDGLRLDAVHAFLDRSATHFLEQLSAEVNALEAQLERHLVLIAESDLNQPLVVTPREANGYGINAQWSDDFHHALHAVLTGERDGYYSDFGSLGQLAKALKSVFVYDGQYSEHRRRNHGRPVNGLAATRFLGYMQNHDQIGNRAQGDRSSQLLGTGRLEIAAALVLLSPFVPMLFQGEEFAASSPFQYFTDHDDVEVGHAVTEGRRREFASFGWTPEDVPNPQATDSFERSKLNWDEVEKEPHRTILEWHRKLIALRHLNPDLVDGRLETVHVEADEERHVLTLRRGRFEIVCNLGESPLERKMDGTAALALCSDASVAIQHSGELTLPADSVAIVQHAGSEGGL
jgi:maltooligosyltrehalose trehalohydrolase